MAKIIQFRQRPKPDTFVEEIDTFEQLYHQGELEKVLIISICKDGLKCCTSNGLTVEDGVKLCKDFIKNPNDYIDE